MLGSTHLLFSLLFGSFLFDYFHPNTLVLKIIFSALMLAGTFLPDIDFKMPLTKHRGIFHTIWPILLILAVNFSLKLPFSILPLAFGYGSHLLADMLTPFGVSLLHPLHKHRIRSPIRTGSAAEFGVAAVIMAVLLMRQV